MAMERMKQQLLLSHHHQHRRLLFPCKSSCCERKSSSLVLSPIWGCPPSTSRSSSSSSLPNSSAWRISSSSSSSSKSSSSGWLSSFFGKKEAAALVVPEIVRAGDPVLHEAAKQVAVEEIGSDRIQKIIEQMISAMRKAPGVGLAAPQIAIPLRIIVLEDTKEYISYARKDEVEAQDRRPFDLLVIVNPKLKKKGNKSALFFEGCLSVDGFRAVVERHLEVEVTGWDREGRPLKVDASGWQARILQHECDHLDGTIYVDKLVPRTFRTVENLDMPLPVGCPPLGAR